VGVAAKMDRVQGVRWVSLKGQGGDCGGAQRDKDPGELAGDSGRPLRGGEREGADWWGHGVSGRAVRAVRGAGLE